MVDEIDIAERLRENQLQLALAKHQKNIAQNKGSEFCEECGVKMLKERQKAGYSLCIECAKDRERMESLFAK